MARPASFSSPTILYHPTEGPRLFGVGEQDPGNAWSEMPGGDGVGSATTAQALKDLIAAQEQNEAMGRQLASAQHDAAQAGRRADEATEALSAAKQEAIDAIKARDDAEKVAADLTVERDAARAEAEGLRAKLAAFDGDGDGEPGGAASSPEKDELIAQLTELKADFDGRWGVSKLRKALDAATAPKA